MRHSEREDTLSRLPKAYKRYVDILGLRPGDKLLDFGCGKGHLLKLAEENGCSTFGIDISETAIRQCRDRLRRSTLLVGDEAAMDCFEDNFFDYITMIGVLEHLRIGLALEKAHRILNKDGKILIMVPNKDFFVWKLKLKTAGTQQKEIKETLMPLRSWINVIEDHGFNICDVYYDEEFIWNEPESANIELTKLFENIMKRIVLLMLKVTPIKYTYQLIFVCRKGGSSKYAKPSKLRGARR